MIDASALETKTFRQQQLAPGISCLYTANITPIPPRPLHQHTENIISYPIYVLRFSRCFPLRGFWGFLDACFFFRFDRHTWSRDKYLVCIFSFRLLDGSICLPSIPSSHIILYISQQTEIFFFPMIPSKLAFTTYVIWLTCTIDGSLTVFGF